MSFLLGKGKNAVDEELGALFTSKPVVQKRSNDAPRPQSKKRKLSVNKDHNVSSSSSRIKKEKFNERVVEDSKSVVKAPTPPLKPSKGDGRNGQAASDALNQSSLDSSSESEDGEDEDSANSDGSSSNEISETNLVHETLSSSKSPRKAKKAKYAPSDETMEQRNQRTIFIGGVNVEVVKKKNLLKHLHRHILSQMPNNNSSVVAKIESTRLRSIPFQKPTSKLPDDDERTERSAKWRQSHNKSKSNETGDGETDDAKKYLTPSQKKKVAFIKHELHSEADTCNAYVVFAHVSPDSGAGQKSATEVMDPYEAAKLAVSSCNGSVFMSHTLRVALASSGEKGQTEGGIHSDPKMTIFVGSLDFAAKEEVLRAFFEAIVTDERGPAPSGTDKWVSRVRIIRDKETQLGKGFGYVSFTDRECVDEILGLASSEPQKLKFGGRKIRVMKCKTVPSISSSGSSPSMSRLQSGSSSLKVPRPAKPRADPKIYAEKLASMSKEDRKAFKKNDADRVRRRADKKKARSAIAKTKTDSKVEGRKQRTRERKDKKVLKKSKKSGQK